MNRTSLRDSASTFAAVLSIGILLAVTVTSGAQPAGKASTSKSASAGAASSATSKTSTTPPGKPLSLEEALHLGVENSRDVKSAKMNLEASRSDVSRANSGYFPTLNAVATAGTYHDRYPNPGDIQIPPTPRDRNEYQGRLDLAETLFSGFSTVAQADAAKAETRAQEHGLIATQMGARADLIKTYFGIQTTKRKIQSEEEVLRLKKAQDERVRRRRSAGRATDLDSVQSEYGIHEQEPHLNTLRAQLETLFLHLNRLLGADVDARYELTDLLEPAQQALDKVSIGKLFRFLPDGARTKSGSQTSRRAFRQSTRAT